MADTTTERLSQLLKQLLLTSASVESAIASLVSEYGVAKRIAESVACGLGVFPRRYASNEGTLGQEGQQQLLQSKVLVAGLGGLGGYVLEQLVRSGIGVVNGVDTDDFDDTNLNRQLLADLTSIGQSKAEVASRRVAEINDAVVFYPRSCRVEDLTEEEYSGADLIFDCLDRIPSKIHLQEMGERLAIPIIHGAIGGWYGQVAVVWPGSRLLSNLYGTKREGIEQELGNPAFTPGLIASLMVSEGIKVLTGKKDRENSIFFVDLLNSQWETVSL